MGDLRNTMANSASHTQNSGVLLSIIVDGQLLLLGCLKPVHKLDLQSAQTCTETQKTNDPHTVPTSYPRPCLEARHGVFDPPILFSDVMMFCVLVL